MSILLISTVGPMEPWVKMLNEAFPADEVYAFPEIGDPDKVEIVLVAHPRPEVFARLTNLKLIVGLRAGVDDLLTVAEIDPNVPIVRAQEPDGDRMIDEYVLMHVLRHHRCMYEFVAAKERRDWINPGVRYAAERNVGFMGFGVIARSAARLVRDVGFKVAAWSRTPKSGPGIESFAGPDGFRPFLARTEILVNLLAVTPETIDIVNADSLGMLPKGASFINIGRGEHVDDGALIAALDSGQIAYATLDVFRTEPLPRDHPFWTHPKVTLMPHTARRPRADRIIPHAVENIRRFREGRPLLQRVDRARGY